MPLIIRVPRNDAVVRQEGAYKSGLNVLDRKQTAVQRQLRRGGLASYEPSTQAALLGLVEVSPRPAVFFDVGAHIGLYSALIATVFADGEVDVRAFEPTPATADLARRLAKANRVDVHVEQVAMSSSPGRAQLYISATAETSNSMVEGFRESAEVVDVEVTTIDEYCRRHELEPSVIKIDVETLEAQVLLGGLQTFGRARPAIVCEILPSADHAGLDDVLGKMSDLGYVLHRVDKNGTWVRTALGDYRRHLSHDHRDWLLTHGQIPRGFAKTCRRWLSAIEECTQDTNVLTPGGTALPDGWDRLYPPRLRAEGSGLTSAFRRLAGWA